MKKFKYFRLKAIIFITLVNLIMIIVIRYLHPIIQNFPTFGTEGSFQKMLVNAGLAEATHFQRYVVAFVIVTIICLLIFLILFKNITNLLKKSRLNENVSEEAIIKIRKDCINIPYKYYFIQLLTMLIVGVVFTLFLVSDWIAITTFIIMITSMIMLTSLVQFIYLQSILGKILLFTYSVSKEYRKNIGFRMNFSKNLMIQIIPFLIVSIMLVSLFGYARTSKEIGDMKFNYYQMQVKMLEITRVDKEDLMQVLGKVEFNDERDAYFIIPPNRDKIFISNSDMKISAFFLSYMDAFLEKTNGRVGDDYGTPQQGYTREIIDENGEKWYIGVIYRTDDITLLSFYFSIMLGVSIFYVILLYLLTRNISRNMVDVSKSLEKVIGQVESNDILPIMSNDEIGDLSYSYNKIQEKFNGQVVEIRQNQKILLEKERLASLGQMIGGIAHNLKTPIMSIAGAYQAITDLTDEYEQSIGDPDVTAEDHRAIAAEIRGWTKSISNQTSYMSDIITTVKGQAVTFSNEEKLYFTVKELLDRINILMQHELKYALTNLNMNIDVPDNLQIYGNINSLIQIINNMIINSIQAYDGKENEKIDLLVYKENDELIIAIKDYGPRNLKNSIRETV